MAKHRLHRAEVGAACQEMGGERMAQGMGRNFFFDAGSQSVTPNYLPESLPCERPTGAIEEEISARLAFQQTWPSFLGVPKKFFPRPFPKRYGPHLGSFALDGQVIALKIDLLEP